MLLAANGSERQLLELFNQTSQTMISISCFQCVHIYQPSRCVFTAQGPVPNDQETYLRLVSSSLFAAFMKKFCVLLLNFKLHLKWPYQTPELKGQVHQQGQNCISQSSSVCVIVFWKGLLLLGFFTSNLPMLGKPYQINHLPLICTSGEWENIVFVVWVNCSFNLDN